MRIHYVLVTLAVALGAAAPAAAQIRQGEMAYIEADDGSLALYRRIDHPFEGDARAHFQRVEPREQDAFVRTHGSTAIPIIDRSAVISRTGGSYLVSEAAVTGGGVSPGAVAEVGYQEPLATETAITEERVEVSSVEMERPMIRPRFGVSALGGGTVAVGDNLAEDPEGFMGGIALRVGVQLGDWFSIYYQPAGFVSALEVTAAGEDYDEAFTLWNSLLVDVTLFHFVSIAAGPSLDFYWGCEATSQGQAGCAQEEPLFGLHGRAAVNLGGAFEGQRGAVSLSFDIHPTWFDDDTETLALLGGIGIELY